MSNNAIKIAGTWTEDFRKYSPSWVDEKYAQRLVTDLMVELTQNKNLAACSPTALKGVLTTVASMGLTIGGPRPDAHLVCIKGKPDVWPGYHGYIKLMERNPKVSHVKPKVVYAADKFDYEEGTDPWLKHKDKDTPSSEKTDDKITHAYAIVFWKDGSTPLFTVLERDELNIKKEIALKKAWNKKECRWVTHFPAMCKKSAIIAIAKYMSLDDDYNRLAEMDEKCEKDSSQEQKTWDVDYVEQNSDEYLISELEGES